MNKLQLIRSVKLISKSSLLKSYKPSSFSKPTHQFKSFSTSSTLLGFKHKNSKFNNEDTPFDFTPEMYEKVYATLKKYPNYGQRSAILPLLHLAQEQCGGWVPLNAMRKIAEICGIHQNAVYECATFYTMYNREPVGKYHVCVCVTTPCMVRGSDELLEAIEEKLGITLGETTEDNLITLGEMECLGACVNAPMLVVSDYSNPPDFKYDYYEDLTVEKTIEIISAIQEGKLHTIPKGPQNGRKAAMPKTGRTSLFEDPPGPYCRDIDKE